MEDMDDARIPFGTAADFSKWNMGVKGFEHMKVRSTEKVIEPVEEKVIEPVEEKVIEPVEEEVKRDIPRTGTVNPIELKNIAVRLLPSADKVNPEDYDNVCEKAIDLAFNFLRVWDLKVQIS